MHARGGEVVMKVRSAMAALVVISIVGLTGAADGGAEDDTPPILPTDVPATTFLYDHDGAWIGTADFVPVPDGMFVSVYIEGQPPGDHGIHLHAVGACGDTVDPVTGAPVPFGGAGAHFDPGLTNHHGALQDPANVSHGGDLGNIHVGADGIGILEVTKADLTLDGPASILGRGLIIHAGTDDLVTQPTGGSGGRIACGVIVAQSSEVGIL
jgi:Cu-Zn family superoxide dismutase